MSSQIETCIGLINESCDTRSAYFSFTTDDTGEHGVIKANKDGLRLYALELLKKSNQLESDPSANEVLFFDELEWLVDDAGYNLIWGVEPCHITKDEIAASTGINGASIGRYAASTGTSSSLRDSGAAVTASLNKVSGWLPSLIILSGGLIIVTIAAFKWFH